MCIRYSFVVFLQLPYVALWLTVLEAWKLPTQADIERTLSSVRIKVEKVLPESKNRSKFEHVKNFAEDRQFLLNTWIVVKVNANTERCDGTLEWMTLAAKSVIAKIEEIALGYGGEDEFSFVFKKDVEMCKRSSRIQFLTEFLLKQDQFVHFCTKGNILLLNFVFCRYEYLCL